MASYVVLKDQSDKVFLMRRKNASWMDGFYNIPAGRVERHETILESAIREVKEEASVDILPKDMRLFLVSNRFTGEGKSTQTDWIDFFYVADKWQGTLHIAESDKCDHADWYAIDDNSIEIVPNIKDALNYLKENKLCYGLHSPDHDYFKKKVA
jgi:ADP-ribose pyrophosphatase YjhB (NUDIX family)